MALTGTDLLDRLLEASQAPVIASDLQGRILVFNAAAEVVLGWRAADAMRTLHVRDLYVHASDARRVLARIRVRAPGVPAHVDAMDVTLRARNGALVPVRLTAALVRDADGTERATVGCFEDRRESIALGQRLQDATGQILASERKAASVAAAGTAAHAMSQPLTAAMGNLEMATMIEGLPPEVEDRLARAYEQLERLRRIVGDFSRITARPPEDVP